MVSVIIPAYNCGRYLEEAVCSALAQTYEELEILVIDDCSTDDTIAIASKIANLDTRIKTIRNDHNLGVAATRNRGIKESAGEYIAFLDGDDAWQPDKLERQLSWLEETQADLCYTAYSFMDEDGLPIRHSYPVPEETSFEVLLRENVIGLSTVLIRRSAIGGVRMRGEFAHEDYVFWLELLGCGIKAVGINEPLTRYRISASSRSGNKRKAAKNRWLIYRKFLKMGRLRSGITFLQYGIRGIKKHYVRSSSGS